MGFESNESCIVCNFFDGGSVCFHHLKTQKSYPEHRKKRWNLIPVCLRCHNNFHSKGTVYMANSYPSVQKWLLSNNWEFCTLTEKWRHKDD